MTKQFDPKHLNGFMHSWENGNIAAAMKESEEIEPAWHNYYYSNFQSLIIGKDEFAKKLEIAKNTIERLQA